jgi:hypothetical protein
MELDQYFREKIERELHFYEGRAALIDDRYIAQVERLAKRTTDKAVARFFLETMTADRIKARVADIRDYLQSGRIIEADQMTERLKRNIHIVDDHIRHPYFAAGAKVSLGGKKAAAARWGSPDARSEKVDKMRKMYDSKRAKGLSKGEADRAVGKFFGVDERTVRTARTGK